MMKFFGKVLSIIGALAVLAILTVSSIADLKLPFARKAPRKVRMLVTAYDAGCKICCGKYAKQMKTAIGSDASEPGVAADFKLLPPGTELRVPGVVGILSVDDTGSGMRKSARNGRHHIDLRLETHEAAQKWGRRELVVEVMPAGF